MQTQESKIDTGKALDADLVDTESIRTDSTVQDDSSRSGNDTDADDADIRPIYDESQARVDQYPETCQVKSPMLDSSPDNQTTEYSKQSLESENILLKETVDSTEVIRLLQSKVDRKPHMVSNVDIHIFMECKQTMILWVAEKDDISETIVKVDSQMMIQKNGRLFSQTVQASNLNVK
ncbi:hypothetical protein Tco_0926233 [Tanacetum coccineum]|uniref:Uncharacterized protein n=1 Tax=Tanacetum coccineum TaxID=301880 RepID=A0ABQ5DG91_9ASTR